jgi:PAS domain S-box-containing protein
MALADTRNGVTIASELWITLGNLTDVFVATLGTYYLFRGVPQLGSLKAFAKYCLFAVLLAPLTSALVGAFSSEPGGYWLQWRLWFFADALAFLTVTPAMLSWASEGHARRRNPENYLELAALMIPLLFFGYLTFLGTGRWQSPAMLYSLVPLLLWAALRMELKGASTSIIVIAFLSIWGAAQDRGPFTGRGPLNNALAIQLFLFFAAISFIVLAVLVEEERRTRQELIDEGYQLAEAQRVAQVGSWWWEPRTDTVTWSEELYRIAKRDPRLPAPNYAEHERLYTQKSWKRLQRVVERALRTGEPYELDLEMLLPDGSTKWLMARGEAVLDKVGNVVNLRGSVKDVTERKRAEEALRESEERFRLVANTAPVMIWMSGPDKRCTYVNQRWLEFTGRSSEAELAGDWAHGIHPDEFEKSLETYSWGFDRREAFRMEYRLMRHDGEYRWIIDHGVPRSNPDGSFAGYIGSAIDVTDRKLAERELALANERLRIAMESGKSTGWDWDIKSGRDTWFGDLQTMFGIPSDTYEGTPEDFLNRQLYPEDRVRVVEEAKNAMENKMPYASEHRILGPDGTVRWVAVKGKFFYSAKGEPERMVGMKVDITERKLMEVALRESEERLRLAAQAGKMYAFEWDTSTDVITRSEEITHIPGLVGAPARLTKKELLAEVHPEDRARFVNSIAEVTVERPKCHASFRVLRSDGSVLWLERTGHAFFDKQGNMVRMIGMVADITERKLAEEALSTVSQKLIEAQEQERSRLARELHDDVNQRLALICLNLQRLKQDLPSSEGRLSGRIREVWQSATDVADDIQHLSHQLHSPKLEILGLASAAAGFCRELSDQKAVEIEFHSENVQRELPQEVSLPLFRVLQEALQNAIKHSGSKRIRVLLKQEGSEVELAVNDAGVGFEVEEAIKGKGLGLISMIERLKMARGRLSIDSAPQHGTTLHARVPINPRTKSAGTAS